jgi:hypothetical protein
VSKKSLTQKSFLKIEKNSKIEWNKSTIIVIELNDFCLFKNHFHECKIKLKKVEIINFEEFDR